MDTSRSCRHLLCCFLLSLPRSLLLLESGCVCVSKKCWSEQEIATGHRHTGPVREAPFNLSPPLFGHCPNSNYTPPPALKRALWGTFFQARFSHFKGLYASGNGNTCSSLNKFPKPPGQGFRPPHNQANARLNLENSSLKKCPKPSGQGFRPPPPNGQCPNRGGDS